MPYGHADHEVVVQLDDLIPGDRIRLYTERGLEEETSVDSEGGVTLTVNAMHRRFCGLKFGGISNRRMGCQWRQ